MQTKALEMNIAATGDVSYANVLRHCMQGVVLEIRAMTHELTYGASKNRPSRYDGNCLNVDRGLIR